MGCRVPSRLGYPGEHEQAMKSSRLKSESKAEGLAARFRKMFHASPRIFRAPGRVNVIGEHTDYNDGFVMPAAIGLYTWIAAAKREDRTLEAYSDRFDESITLLLDELDGPPRKHWSDFVRGVAAVLQKSGYDLCGANLMIHGEVPIGAGLSSSASLEVALALALAMISGLCQKAEHEYAGTLCGIMDQFITVFGEAGHALMLDCRSLQHQLLPIPHHLRLVVCNSMVRHEHSSGEYNRRREECEEGVRLLQTLLPAVRALRDVQAAELEVYKDALPEVVYRRCRHVVTENERVLAAAKALQTGDAKGFGNLMYRSHASLRDDYQVSCKELDLLVELASSSTGVHGARMTGGGFGGCTVNLVEANASASFEEHMGQAYRERTGITPTIFACDPAHGAQAWPGSQGEE